MIEEAVRDAIIAELERQAMERPQDLAVTRGETTLTVDGTVNLEELVMAVVGALAGGP